MKDVIIRNLERLLLADADDTDREAIEPMTEWKWQRLVQKARKYGVGPWLAQGIRLYEDDFFLQLSPALRQQIEQMDGERNDDQLERMLLQIDRSLGPMHHLTRASLQAYISEFVDDIKNIEE